MEKLLRANDVATMLGVRYETALAYMREMKCVNLSANPNVKNPRYAVQESELDRWMEKRAEVPAQREMPVKAHKTHRTGFDYDRLVREHRERKAAK